MRCLQMELVVTRDHLTTVVHEYVIHSLEAEAFFSVAAPASEHHCVDGVGTATRPLKQNAVLDEPDHLSTKTTIDIIVYWSS